MIALSNATSHSFDGTHAVSSLSFVQLGSLETKQEFADRRELAAERIVGRGVLRSEEIDNAPEGMRSS